MALVEEFRKQGNWLFRWRSYLPLLFLALFAMQFGDFDWPFGSYAVHEVWEFVCLGVSLLGLLVRVITIGHTPAATSGRNARKQVADQLNTSGIYSTVRHPLYLGNYLIGLGISLILLVWWLPVIYSLMFWIYYERIMFAEEAFLREKFKEPYEQWAAATPAFLPRPSQWRKPALKFSFRNVLRREYTGLLVVIGGHSATEILEHLVKDHRLVYEPFWAFLLFGGLAMYLLLRILKRETSILEVPGR
jgi:protein-S-isoprenylcysteine O-methyltransferase Ste14